MDKEILERSIRRYNRVGWALLLTGALFSSLGGFITIPLWGGAIGSFILSLITRRQLQPKDEPRSYTRPAQSEPVTSSTEAPKRQVMISNMIIWMSGGAIIFFSVLYALSSGDEDKGTETELPAEEQPVQAVEEEMTAFERGSAAYNQNDFENAKKIFEQITQQEPNNADAWLSLGNVYYSQKNYSYAERYYDQALSIKADYIEALYNKALIKYDQEQYGPAGALLSQALQINANYSDAIILQADCLYATKNYSESRPHYRKAYDLGSRIPELIHRLAWLEDQNQNSKEAVRLYRETLEYDPERKDIYKRLVELDPDKAEAYRQNRLD